jgi:hypothetical protein
MHVMAVPAKTIVDSFREALQDLRVPELKALRVSFDSLRTEMHLRTDGLQKEIQLRDDSLRAELKLRDEKLRAEIQSGDAATQELVRSLSQKLDFAIDIRERLAALEARLPDNRHRASTDSKFSLTGSS